MHLGLIQVVAKPNYRLGINSPILLLLRDIRMKQFQDSIIAILESNLHDGPALFNCYPNFSMCSYRKFTVELIRQVRSVSLLHWYACAPRWGWYLQKRLRC
uniref:Movement protein n=1 Tax=Cajanus cajan TaxID=3821 RepID=A0A151QS68_CAJCA|nr:Movement protein [Cajanus cajan]